jgi:hypothetical protein
MLVTEVYKPKLVSIKKLADNKPLDVTDKGVAVQDIPVFYSIAVTESEPSVKIQSFLSLLEIFSIKFSYLKQIHHTKVMKVNYKNNAAFYKVVLCSSISNNASICWLEHSLQGWSMLLGRELNEGLKRAITSAIECRQELA